MPSPPLMENQFWKKDLEEFQCTMAELVQGTFAKQQKDADGDDELGDAVSWCRGRLSVACICVHEFVRFCVRVFVDAFVCFCFRWTLLCWPHVAVLVCRPCVCVCCCVFVAGVVIDTCRDH